MDITTFLREAIETPGLPGHEAMVARYIRDAFAPYVDEATIDPMYNVIAHAKGSGNGPRVLVTAHIDEIGLIVTAIEKDGCLRFGQMGGVDPRILPASEVLVLCDPKAPGVIGAIPPHLLSAADQSKNYTKDNLYIDVGLSYEEARSRIPIGTPVQLVGPYTELAGDRACGKTFDDRACVAMLLLAARQLARAKHDADVYFVLAAQEEVGCRGIQTAAYHIAPDLGIAVDVTHCAMPGTAPNEAFALDTLVLSCGPNIHPKMLAALQDTAKRHHINTTSAPVARVTWTDAGPLQISRDGVPTALLELPLKYMHTTVEMCGLDTLREGGRLISAYLGELGGDWEVGLCL